MAKYIATFEMTALVRAQIEVEAPNQQEGLICAHDLVHQAKPGEATVINLNVDSAVNTGFERLPETLADLPSILTSVSQPQMAAPASIGSSCVAAPASGPSLPPSPLEVTGQYRVDFFDTLEQTGPAAKSSGALAYGSAKTLAETALDALSQYGSAAVFDQFGSLVLQTKAPSGGFEVQVHYPDGRPMEVFSWLASRNDAKQVVSQLMSSRKGYAFVRLIDFTDRKAGPRVLRDLR